jgi:acylphosphatase
MGSPCVGTPVNDPGPERWRLEARGRVQMVGYRARVQREAHRRGLSGRVWNDPVELGLVWVEVQGAPGELERFRAAIERPEGASRPERVMRVALLTLENGERGFGVVAGRPAL